MKKHYSAEMLFGAFRHFLSALALAILLSNTLGSCSGGSGNGSDLNTNLLPVKVGEKWGYVNQKGEYIINPQFDAVTPFTNGRARVIVNDKYGYIDEKGTYVVNPKYRDATIFSEDRAWVVEEGKAPTLIDRDGKELFDMKEIERAYPFYDGLARVQVIGADGISLYGFINKKGEYVVNPAYEYANNFSDALAKAKSKEMDGYINTAGKFVINDSTFYFKNPFYNGYAVVGVREDYGKSSYGVIDNKGKYVINPQFDEIMPDVNGFVIENSEGQWGWCDSKGKIVINPQFDKFLCFSNNDLAPVAVGNKWGYIDRKGKLVINPQFDMALPFIDNKIAVVSIGSKAGFIGKEGKYTVNPQFSDFDIEFYSIYLFGSQELTSYVESDYFDAEAAVDLIVKNVNEKGVHELAPGVTISHVLKKIGKDESVLSRYGSQSLQDVYYRELGPSMNVHLKVTGDDFFNTVSDGWWGYHRVYNPKAKVDMFDYIIEMKDRGVGKQDQLIEVLRRRFNVAEDGITGRIGKYDVDLIEMGNGVDIRVYKDSKGNNSKEEVAMDSTSVEEDEVNVDMD